MPTHIRFTCDACGLVIQGPPPYSRMKDPPPYSRMKGAVHQVVCSVKCRDAMLEADKRKP